MSDLSVPEESFPLSESTFTPDNPSAAPWFRNKHKHTRTYTCMRSCNDVLITDEAGGSLTSAGHRGIFKKKWNCDNEERHNACVIENVQYADMTIWISQGAAQMGMMCLKMDWGLKEMRTLSLMCGQITAAEVVDGDWMKSKSQAKVVLGDDPQRFD